MRIVRTVDPVGIVDIGSNSIRLCVYDGASRVPVPIFNEKAICALAQGLGVSGQLNPAGVQQGLRAVARYAALARAMGCQWLDVLATAAVRDASDGADFVAEVERRCQVGVRVLSGGEEASLAAMGVLCGTPGADGIVCDLGGGSLELVTVREGAFGQHVTMPLGLLRLAEASGDNRAVAGEIVERHLAPLTWLGEGGGRNLYAVGGAWRALARICIAQTGHPLTVLDNFALDAREAIRIIDLVAAQSKKSLEKVPGVSKKRVASLPLAALVLDRVLRAVQPKQLVFSIYGMREGRFFERLPEAVRREDPLLSVCRQIAQASSRFPEHGDELMTWMAPLFPNDDSRHARIRYAASLVSDTFWNEHPDYRAEQAFLRMLRLPFMGVPHEDRAEIALTVYTRYQGGEDAPLAQRTTRLLDDAAVKRCRVTGNALRLAHALSGGTPHQLARTRIAVEGKDLVLEVPAGNPAFDIDAERIGERLVKSLECERLIFRKRPA